MGAPDRRTFQVALFVFAATSPDPNDERYVTSQAIPPNGINMAGYAAQVDRLARAHLAPSRSPRTGEAMYRQEFSARARSRSPALFARLVAADRRSSPGNQMTARARSGRQPFVGNPIFVFNKCGPKHSSSPAVPASQKPERTVMETPCRIVLSNGTPSPRAHRNGPPGERCTRKRRLPHDHRDSRPHGDRRGRKIHRF